MAHVRLDRKVVALPVAAFLSLVSVASARADLDADRPGAAGFQAAEHGASGLMLARGGNSGHLLSHRNENPPDEDHRRFAKPRSWQ